MQTFLIDFLSNYTSESITLENTIMVLGIACILACYIFVVYRLVTKKIFYSKSFNIALAVIAVVTAAIILAVQSSIVISLGMVGALSIVRFRTAVKEPMDLCFLFWSIAVGICCGARVMEVAFILSALLTILVVILNMLPVGRAPMILVMNLKDIKEESEVIERVKSRNISMMKCNMVIELRVKDGHDMVQDIASLDVIDIP